MSLGSFSSILMTTFSGAKDAIKLDQNIALNQQQITGAIKMVSPSGSLHSVHLSL